MRKIIFSSLLAVCLFFTITGVYGEEDFSIKREIIKDLDHYENDQKIFKKESMANFLVQKEIKLNLNKIFHKRVTNILERLKSKPQFNKNESNREFVETKIIDNLGKLEKKVANKYSKEMTLEQTNLIFNKTAKLKKVLEDSYLEYASGKEIDKLNKNIKERSEEVYRKNKRTHIIYTLVQGNIIHFFLSLFIGALIILTSYYSKKFLSLFIHKVKPATNLQSYYFKLQLVITTLWLLLFNSLFFLNIFY